MIKTTVSLFGLLLFSFGAALAQPVIDPCSHRPDFGDVFRVYSFNCDTVDAQEGPSGPNVFWDFSGWDSVPGQSGVWLDSVIDPSGSPYYATFSQSNLATLEGNQIFNYYQYSDSEIVTWGYQSIGFGPYYATDPETRWVCPMNFQEQFLDYSFYDGGPDDKHKYFVYFRFDGYGKIRLPGGVEYDVVRIFKKWQRKNGNYYLDFLDYEWYETTHFRRVCLITNAKSSMGGSWIKRATITLQSQVIPVSTSPEQEALVQILPNPVSSSLTVRIPPAFLPAQVTLHDLAGREVLQAKVSTTDTQFDVSHLPAGIYSCSVAGPRGQRLTPVKVLKE